MGLELTVGNWYTCTEDPTEFILHDFTKFVFYSISYSKSRKFCQSKIKCINLEIERLILARGNLSDFHITYKILKHIIIQMECIC